MLKMRQLCKGVLASILSMALILPTGMILPGQAVKAAAGEDVSYDDGSGGLTELEGMKTVSADESNVVRIWKDDSDTYYYSVYRKDAVAIECSKIGLVTADEDLSTGLTLDESATKHVKGKEEYDWIQGSSSHVSKEYNETSFTFTKGNSKITMIFRVFNDGMAYRYEVDGDTSRSDEVTEVKSEESSFILPETGTIWTMWPSVTYEAGSYDSKKASELKKQNGNIGSPILGRIPTDEGECWILLAEANVYNEKEPYCASVFQTKAGSRALQTKFGQFLQQEQDETLDGKNYEAKYSWISSVKMTDQFHTPWRLAILSDNLEGLANSSLVSDLNPPAQGDFSWVKPGTSSWSWWSTTSDLIDYDTMFDYIDYAEETGQRYCLVDFGWERWENYEEKVRTLVDYADPKGVDLILWYGVNKFDQPHLFDLDSESAIEEQFAWCEKMGIKGVKVDYLNSDSQFAMKVMYDLASIAAKHKLVINYHGCTDPNGENRTFPNILSSEAVCGAEYCKWSDGSPVQTLLTLPYARNVLGSMEFTPVGMSLTKPVLTKPDSTKVSATDGFMLAMPVVYESAVQTLAHSAYVYPGYKGSSLFTNLPSSWDESKLLAGYPGESVVRARRSGENWYVGAMTNQAAAYDVSLNFLEPGETYYAYIYQDNKDRTDLEVETKEVTSETVLNFNLLEAGGCAIKLTKNDPMGLTVYDEYKYYEAENANMGTGTTIEETDYVSGKKFVDNIGKGETQDVTFDKVHVLEDGEYELKLFIISPKDDRNLSIQVNDGEPIEMKKLVGVLGDGRAVASKSIRVALKAGNNKVRLYNKFSQAPGIDRIAVSKVDLSNAELTLEKSEYDFNGKRNMPDVTVKRGDTILKIDEDYHVYYSNCKEVGTATATVIGIGNYSGRLTKEFTIKALVTPVPKPSVTPGLISGPGTSPTGAPSIDAKVKKPAKMKLSSVKSTKKKQAVVTFKKLSKVNGYQISYSLNKKFKKAKTVTVKSSASKAVIKKLKSKKKYFVRIRAIRKNGTKKLYGTWSNVKSVKIK